MIKDQDNALKVAEFLLKIKAVQLSPEKPFTWASGWKSPIYCDNRKILSYPDVRTYVRQSFVQLIEEEFPMPECIAGVATGGIAIGALVAQELGLPFVYVRSESKSHGLNNQIEGELREGQNVVVIEDLVSSGMSSLKAVQALRKGEANVTGMAAIFTYGFNTATDNFKEHNCNLKTLCDYNTLLQVASKEEYITDQHLNSLSQWRNNPAAWLQ